MKKGEVSTGIIGDTDFPDKGYIKREDGKVLIKHAIPYQKVEYILTKKRGDRAEGRILRVLEKSEIENNENSCIHMGICGGCLYQTVDYSEQLKLKERQVLRLLKDSYEDEFLWEGINASPSEYAYRNKMEYSFGDEFKDGPLSLGMHKRGSHYDIVEVSDCNIVDEDFNKVLKETLNFFREKNISYHHKLTHKGFLRHLLVRRSIKNKELLIDIVVSTNIDENKENDINAYRKIDIAKDRENNTNVIVTEHEEISIAKDKENDINIVKKIENNISEIYANDISLSKYYIDVLNDWKDRVLKLDLSAKIKGILYTINNSLADAVINQGTYILYGDDYITENLLGLNFKITPFSFFQTNSLGAELLYSIAGKYIGDTNEKAVFDLYSGTGTIAQLLAGFAKKVYAVEIVKEAVEAAKENAALNNINNCTFIAGDVLKVIDELEDKPDIIVLDPPREGINPKALPKIMDFNAETIVYISCKPSSLARDLKILKAGGYKLIKACAIDMFPHTANVETVVKLVRKTPDAYIDLTVDMDELDLTASEAKATYQKIKEYIKEKYDVKVSSLYIAQIKQKHGIIERENYNTAKSENAKQPQCPPEKEKLIEEALRHFKMIS